MKPFLKLFAKYFAIFFIFQWILGSALDSFHQKQSFFKPSKILNSQEWKNAKVLILGSSRALTSFDSPMIENHTAKKTVNLSMHDTGPSIHQLLFELAIENAYLPELIILQYDQREPEPSNLLYEMDYQFLTLLSNSAVVRDYFSSKMGKVFVFTQIIFPIWKYAYWNTELLFPIPIMLLNPDATFRSNSNGDYDYPEKGQQLEPCSKSSVEATQLYRNSQLFNYLELTEIDQKISFVLTTAPTYNFKYDFNFDGNYINASNWFNCDAPLFYDEIHLNSKGKKAFTINFIEAMQTTLLNN